MDLEKVNKAHALIRRREKLEEEIESMKNVLERGMEYFEIDFYVKFPDNNFIRGHPERQRPATQLTFHFSRDKRKIDNPEYMKIMSIFQTMIEHKRMMLWEVENELKAI